MGMLMCLNVIKILKFSWKYIKASNSDKLFNEQKKWWKDKKPLEDYIYSSVVQKYSLYLYYTLYQCQICTSLLHYICLTV